MGFVIFTVVSNSDAVGEFASVSIPSRLSFPPSVTVTVMAAEPKRSIPGTNVSVPVVGGVPPVVGCRFVGL